MPSHTPVVDGGAVTPDESCVVIVRAWVDGGRVTVRLLASGACGERVAVVTSIDGAARELAEILAALAVVPSDDGSDDRGATPS